jgi:broad specificity phosphatase PhoE
MQFHRFGNPDKNPNFSISLRRAFLHNAPPERKTFFIIRHGESKWNRAEKEHDVGGLLALDHALTAEGVRQAMELAAFWQRVCHAPHDPAPPDPAPPPAAGASARAEDEDAERRAGLLRAFLDADAVYSSPLTRAVQTALAALEGHPALARRPVTLWAGLREVKTAGGLDSVGAATGPAIAERARAELVAAVGLEAAERLAAAARIEHGDCARPWWTPAAAYESPAQQRTRALAFLALARYNGAAAAVYVGHSLLFRAALAGFASPDLARRRPDLARQLRECKLSNAALAAVEVSYPCGGSDPAVEDVVLLRGCFLPA